MLVIALPIVAGTFAYRSLPKEGEPEISAPVAIVVTLYPGASPSEIESLVTNPIEEALSDLKDVDEMRSNSAEGVSVVVIDFQAEADLERSLQKVREKVTDARKDLPDDAEDPEVNEVSFSDIPIMIASVVGDIDPVKLRRLTEDVADEIELRGRWFDPRDPDLHRPGTSEPVRVDHSGYLSGRQTIGHQYPRRAGKCGGTSSPSADAYRDKKRR